MNSAKATWVIIGALIVISLLSKLSSGHERTEKFSNCHPSYSGCLNASASDYDCVGGSGNGPFYTDKVRVTGPDVFGLDRDGNGWGCER